MTPRPAYIAALPREIARLVKGWQFDRALIARGIHLYWCDTAIVACAGMGAARVSLAVQAALTLGSLSSLTSIGWAGACDSTLSVGTVVEASTVIDVRTGERFGTGTGSVLVTVAAPVGVSEKARLAATYSATLVDMEAAAVARLAEAHRLSFYALKAISDDASFQLPGMDRFVTATGHFREAAFGLHVACRPWLWSAVSKMASGSKLAADNLCAEVRRRIKITPKE